MLQADANHSSDKIEARQDNRYILMIKNRIVRKKDASPAGLASLDIEFIQLSAYFTRALAFVRTTLMITFLSAVSPQW